MSTKKQHTAEFLIVNNLTNEIIDLVNHWEDITTSDMQGIAEAIIMKAIAYGKQRR